MPTPVETYEVPTLALLAALVAVFATLCVQGRTHPSRGPGSGLRPTILHRHLLWLAGWLFAVVRLSCQISAPPQTGLVMVISRVAMQLAALMFLASLAPQYLTRKPPVLYIVAFGAPIVACAALVSLDPAPGLAGRAVLLACVLFALCIAALWSLVRNLLPIWFSLLLVATTGTACIWLTLCGRYLVVLVTIHSGVLLMAAALFAAAFRRLTAGVIFTAGGLALWAIPPLVEAFLAPEAVPLGWPRLVNLVKVLTAAGMIVLVLEDQIALNLASQERDRRARIEIERYSGLFLGKISPAEEKEELRQVCEAIAAVSRFRQAAIFFQSPERTFRLAGYGGMEGALGGALQALAQRTTVEMTEQVAGGPHFPRQIGHLTLMDLSPLMQPGDELNQLGFREAYVMGIRARDGRLLGALLLAVPRHPEQPLNPEDVLPLELLVSRIGAAREQQGLLRRLMQSERLAGLGQLAGGVAHELNNPLTAVSGFAEILTDAADAGTREQAGVILHEARRMKQIIESLLRFRKATPGESVPVSLSLLLHDVEKLARRELDANRIQVSIRCPDGLPRVRVDGDQIRQVFVQLTQNAISSLEQSPPERERRLAIEAAEIPGGVQIVFRHSGNGFQDPGRVFDPYYNAGHPGAGPGLGLSICYSIIREHGGELSALNLEPHGAAVVIELPIEGPDEPPSERSNPARLFASGIGPSAI